MNNRFSKYIAYILIMLMLLSGVPTTAFVEGSIDSMTSADETMEPTGIIFNEQCVDSDVDSINDSIDCDADEAQISEIYIEKITIIEDYDAITYDVPEPTESIVLSDMCNTDAPVVDSTPEPEVTINDSVFGEPEETISRGIDNTVEPVIESTPVPDTIDTSVTCGPEETVDDIVVEVNSEEIIDVETPEIILESTDNNALETIALATTIQFLSDEIEITRFSTQPLPEVNKNGAGTIGWMVSDGTIVSIDETAGSITANTYGTVILTAYLVENEDVFAEVFVKVIPNNLGLVVYEGTIAERFDALKKQFPHQKYWNNCENMGIFDPNTYTDKACSKEDHKAMKYCGSFGNGSQCWGFADRIAYGLYGSVPGYFEYGNKTKNGWVYTKDPAVVNYLEPGDWVRIKHSNGEHSFVVWKISGSDVYCVEANWSGRCMIQWGKVRSLSSIKSNFLFVYKNPESKYVDKFIVDPYEDPEHDGKQVYVEYVIDNGKAWISYVDFKGSGSWTIADEHNGYPVCGISEDFELWDIDELETKDFRNDSNLTSIHLGANILDESMYIWGIFGKPRRYTVSEKNPYLCSVDGVVYTRDMKTLVLYPEYSKATAFTVPEGVEKIDDRLSDKVQNIVLPTTLRSFGWNFSDISNQLHNIEVAAGNPYFCVVNNVVYTADMKKMLLYPQAKTDTTFVVPEGVEEIACAIGDNIEKIVLPSTFICENRVFDLACLRYTHLQRIDVVKNNPYLTSKSGVLYSKDEKSLLMLPSCWQSNSYSIPYGTTSAFIDDIGYSLTFPDTMEIYDGQLYGNKFILNGCKLKIQESFHSMDNLVFLNDAEIIMDETSWDEGYIYAEKVYAEKGSFGERFAKEHGFNFVEIKLVIKPSKLELAPGTSRYISASVPYMSESGTKIIWSSADPKVATVNKSGKVTAVSAGSTVITASINGGKDTARCEVTVKSVPPKKVQLDKSGTVIVNMGSTLKLTPKLTPDGAYTTYKWTSSAKNIATVNNGVVTPVKEGTTTITVKTANGKSAKVKVKVVDPYKPTAVILAESGTVTLKMGETLQLNAGLKPDTAKSTLKWSSSNKKCATVDANGVVKPVKEGTVTITVTTHNKKKDTVKVKVVDPYKPTAVILAESGTVTLKMGETLQLNAGLKPDTAKSTLKWSSSNKKYATVDANGIVTPVKKGTVTITVTTHNGKKDTVKVKVVDQK